jgi:nascent polypeptide-associated complex subunit alpha
MMPGMRGMNQRQMQQAMKRMGIKTEEMKDVEEVIIRAGGKCLVFREPSISVTNIQGQKTFQIMGDYEETEASAGAGQGAPGGAPSGSSKISIPEEDIELVAQQAHVSPEEAREALAECNGEPAEAIIRLMSKK